eukprot:scaffold169218_cov37-Prasinocladus_malaysianus.AAC.1
MDAIHLPVGINIVMRSVADLEMKVFKAGGALAGEAQQLPCHNVFPIRHRAASTGLGQPHVQIHRVEAASATAAGAGPWAFVSNYDDRLVIAGFCTGKLHFPVCNGVDRSA